MAPIIYRRKNLGGFLSPANSPRRTRAAMFGLAALASVISAGCDAPREQPFPPSPLGLSTRIVERQQFDKAHLDDWMIHTREWSYGKKELSDSGQRHLADLIARLAAEGGPIVVEREADTQANADHVAWIVRYLGDHGHTQDSRLVAIGDPVSPGMSGEDAIDVYNSLPRAGSGNSGAPSGSSRTTTER